MIAFSKIVISLSFGALASLGAAQKAYVKGNGEVSFVGRGCVGVEQIYLKAFQFDPGLGACGWTNTSAQAVGTVSNTTFSSYPGATRNPNKNPICGRLLVITSPANKTVKVFIVDFFPEDENAKANDVGMTTAEFATLANPDDGIIDDVTWNID